MSRLNNKVSLIGNTGDDVKMHHFEGGGCLARFPLATNETYKNKNGDKVTNTEWHSIVANGKQAETLDKYLKKGDRIAVQGRLKYRKWQDDSGADRYSTEIHIYDFMFLTTKGERNEGGGGHQNSGQSNQPNTPPMGGDDYDGLPF